jgi:hypothetical protein
MTGIIQRAGTTNTQPYAHNTFTVPERERYAADA